MISFGRPTRNLVVSCLWDARNLGQVFVRDTVRASNGRSNKGSWDRISEHCNGQSAGRGHPLTSRIVKGLKNLFIDNTAFLSSLLTSSDSSHFLLSSRTLVHCQGISRGAPSVGMPLSQVGKKYKMVNKKYNKTPNQIHRWILR